MSPKSKKRGVELPPVAGVKRPAPGSLLPAFDPQPASDGRPRPAKRIHSAPSTQLQRQASSQQYPTPVPTSSTGILSSSPSNLPRARPGLRRTQSTMSERAPLSAVPSIVLPENGDPVLMGRSSNSSHYQLSANRLISRVHVRARYVPPENPDVTAQVEVVCLGWNGVKVHCQGRTWDLGKGDTFTSEKAYDIMLDVQDARVLLTWPIPDPSRSLSGLSETTPELDSSPKTADASHGPAARTGPLYRGFAPESPVSPTPTGRAQASSSSTFLPSDTNAGPGVVTVYEDEHSSDDRRPSDEPNDKAATQSTQAPSQLLHGSQNDVSQSTAPSEPQDFSDRDEENDPLILSFGPQGENLLPRIAAVSTADSPTLLRPALKPVASPPRPAAAGLGLMAEPATIESTNTTSLANHVINQLAFSRLSSTPLSTILNQLPVELKGSSSPRGNHKNLSRDELRAVLEGIPCVGSVRREGKDAAGKALETDYYYLPDLDEDEMRKETVVHNLRKPGLRACRKQHKQYYWRRPKTP